MRRAEKLFLRPEVTQGMSFLFLHRSFAHQLFYTTLLFSPQGPARGRQSPSTVLPRAESVSSLEFRTSGMMGTSRGPSPLTIGLSDTIPLAVAFQELCHAYFRGTDESR